jgi:hypothetical protein
MYILISLSPLPHLSPSPNLSISLPICIFLTISISLSVAANEKKFNEGKGIEKFGACSLLHKNSTFKRQINLDLHGPRPVPNICYIPDIPWLVMFTTFKSNLSNCSHLMRYEYHVLYATMHVQYYANLQRAYLSRLYIDIAPISYM